MSDDASLLRTGSACRQAIAACLAGLCLAAMLASPARAAESLDDWRREVADTRRLAENNPPLAHVIAHRLHAALPVDAPPADRARVLNLLARAEIYLAHAEEAATHAEGALKTAQAGGDKEGQAEANLTTALVAINQGRIDTMGTAIMSALTLLEGVDRPDLLGEAMLRTAMLYRRRGQMEASVTIAMQTMDIAQRNGDPLFLTYALQGMAISMDQAGRHAEAEAYYDRMAEQARLAGSRHLEAYAALGKSGEAARTGRPVEAEAAAREAIAIFRAGSTYFSVAHAQYALADILRSQGRIREALRLLDDSAAIYERYPNKIGLWWVLNTRSADRQALGMTGAATEDAERAYALAKDIDSHVYLTASARQLASLAAARGDFRQAYEYAAQANKTAAEGAQKDASQQLDHLMERFQTEAKQKQIEALTRQTEQNAQEQRWLWTVLAASFLLLAVTGVFLARQRRSNRLQAELNAQVQQASRRLQATLDAVPDLLFEMDLDGRIHDCHSPRADLLTLPPEQLLNRPLHEILPPEATEACLSALAEAESRGYSIGKQYALALPQGSAWFELSVARKSDAADRQPRFIVLARDITERKRIENALRFIANAGGKQDFLAELTRHVGETLGVAYVLIDKLADDPAIAETVTLYAKGAILPNLRYPLAGTPCDEVAGKRVCCYPRGVQALFPEDTLLVDMGAESYAGVPLWDSTGQPIGLIAVLDDKPMEDETAVTQLLQIVAPRAAAELERARSDAQLQASEQAFRALVENSPDSVVRYDRECRRVYVNPAALSHFGCPLEEVLGRTSQQYSPYLDADHFVRLLGHVLDTGDVLTEEQTFRSAEGSIRWGHTRLVPEYGPDGVIASVLSTVRDITELKMAETRLRESYNLLQELSSRRETAREEERKRIAREIHDELGQQLTALRLKVNLLNFQFGSATPGLREATGNVLAMVDQTIQVARDVSTSLRPAALDMGIVAALDWLATTFERNTGISCELMALQEELRLDEDRAMVLFRIAQESLTNAARYSEASHVRISLEEGEDGQVLQIADDGKGFDPDLARTHKFGLVGIKERALAVGGSTTIDTAPGQGTRIRVTIPTRK
ncbi:MAG TPA: PAS domain-containing protein [Rhodocyclaceae bacterium]|nr:PAS domain-containing protein [Rhodocyclaceae bacterium]